MAGSTGHVKQKFTAQEKAILQLRIRIANGELRPDDHIRQEMLATELRLSVVPVREALKILEAEGQVVYRPRRGYFVTRLDLKELAEAYRIRELLENEAIALAIPKLVEEDFRQLHEAIEECKLYSENFDIVALSAANRRFHFALFEAADTPRLTNFIRMVWQATDPYRSLYYADRENRERINIEHDAIMQAARSGNAPLAIRLLSEHRAHAIASLRQTLTITSK
jgi:DNA-binding GntR family transcriptional regulator